MDEAKSKNPQINPEKKVGADGLSKKERRALKVAQKNVNGDVINVNQDTNNIKVKVTENETGPSKAQLKAERRALQEKQRQLKEEAKNVKSNLKETPKKPQNETSDNKEKNKSDKDITKKDIIKKDIKKESTKKPTTKQIELNQINTDLDQDQVYLFNHLRFKSFLDEEKLKKNCCVEDGVHPTFIRLGVKYREKIICGSNSRGLGFLAALKDLIRDYEPSMNVEFCRGLENVLKLQLDYLHKCRPVSVSITNANRHFKTVLNEMQTNDVYSIDEKKDYLIKFIEMYVKDEIETAGQAISLTTQEKICNGDVIITYGW
nr:translation initiation factor eIF-2B subunit delta-like [Onthophagus taurus]